MGDKLIQRASVLLLIAAGLLASVFEQPGRSQDRGLNARPGGQTESRVALVIGNAAYRNAPLINPVNDARDIAAALRVVGFEVIYGENLSQNDMKRMIREFGDKIATGGVGLFYYAGHGVQVKGINYLIPVSAVVTKETEVEYESVEVGFVLAQMETAKNRLNIVILDACRNDPFARSYRSTKSGLASIDAPSGTLIAYATAPGSVASDGAARNGLYTQELLNAMRIPGLKIEEVFKQVRRAVQAKSENQQTPWESSSLVGDFYFEERLRANRPPPRPGPGAGGNNAQPPQVSQADYDEVQRIYNAHKGEKDCGKVRELAERLTAYFSNANLVPEGARYTLLYPSRPKEPTIGNLAKDRHFRIRNVMRECFEN